MAKILGKKHNPYLLGADTHSLTLMQMQAKVAIVNKRTPDTL